MKIRDITRLANVMLGGKVDENAFTKDVMDNELTTLLTDNKILISLVECSNLVLCELAEEYLPLTAKETLYVNEIAPYSQFNKSPLQIISARQNGNVKYIYRPDGVEFGITGEVEVEYSYRPDKKEFLDEIEIGSTQLSERILSYGVCAEYCLLAGEYEEAQVWDKRYKDNLLGALSKKSEMSVKIRQWS